MPELVADQLITIFAMLREGVAEDVTDTVETLTGAQPRGIATLVREHVHVFERAEVGVPR